MLLIEYNLLKENFMILEEKKKIAVSKSGLTFLEVMIVVIILAGIAAIVGPAIFGRLDDARADQARVQIKSLISALDLYHLDNGIYPDSEQGLKALMENPGTGIPTKNWRGPYLQGKAVPKDPWGNDFTYQKAGTEVEIISLGSDGQAGGQDSALDISSNDI